MPAHRAARRTRRSRAAALGTLTLLGVFGPGAGMALAAGDDLNCGDFSYQEDAQDVLDADPSDPNNLDREGDGRACESLPSRGSTSEELGLTDGSSSSGSTHETSASSAASSSSSGSSTRTTPTHDRDCADFSSQAQAQGVLDDDPSDPERLDADDDGVACESFDYGDDSSDSEDDSRDVDVRPAAAATNDYPVGGVAAGDGSGPSEGSDALAYALMGSAAVAGAVAVRHARPGRHRRV
ncbi:excalibur calcium-binding domain-containing protein [Actinomycetospora flava]|uniref:Excalibur calcium-binding domain-containing protein n=1 Tax=Actinomycetospora flava TaxID=3129232 RepID=A0ABU8M8A3_9PSEU